MASDELPGPAQNPTWWDHPEADPLQDMRDWIAAERERAYTPPVYYLRQHEWDAAVLQGLITTDNPMWRPYPTFDD